MRKITCLILMIILSIMVYACGKKAPACSDEEVKALVIQIAKENLEAVGLAGLNFELTAIRTRDVDTKTGRCLCAADLAMTGYGKQTSIAIEYTSELTDSGDEFYVTVDGL